MVRTVCHLMQLASWHDSPVQEHMLVVALPWLQVARRAVAYEMWHKVVCMSLGKPSPSTVQASPIPICSRIKLEVSEDRADQHCWGGRGYWAVLHAPLRPCA